MNYKKCIVIGLLLVLVWGCSKKSNEFTIMPLKNTIIPADNDTKLINKSNQFIINKNLSEIKNKSKELVRSCPSYAHWDQMPCGGTGCKKSCYYIINGTRWDCLDVDREWVLDNCGQINASITY